MAELSHQEESYVQESIDEATTEVSVDAAEAYERGKVDINFFAATILPQVMISPFPLFYVGIFQILVTRPLEDMDKILRFALGLPRGHAKTTFIKVIIAWLIAYDKISFALVICASDGLAESIIEDVYDALGSDNAEAIYGYWHRQKLINNAEEKRIFYHGKNIILKARGAESGVRGINIKHRRPDLIFFDDAQTKENDLSPTLRDAFRKRLVATFKVIAPNGPRLIIWVGNMYSDTCILYQLKNNPSWISLVTGAILEDGEPLWPGLHSLESLMESYFHDESMGEAEVWFAEVMNDPVSSAISLLPGPLPDTTYPEGSLPDGVFITIDPAGFRDISDDNVIVVHYVFDGKGHVAYIDAGIKDPEQLIKRTLQLAVEHGASLIGVEDVAYQQTLLFWFTKYLDAYDVKGIEIVPLKPAGRSKESRIRLFIAELFAGNYTLLGTTKALFVWFAMKYKLGAKKNKDDVLDACSYGLDVRNTYWHLVKNLKTAGLYAIEASVQEDNTPF